MVRVLDRLPKTYLIGGAAAELPFPSARRLCYNYDFYLFISYLFKFDSMTVRLLIKMCLNSQSVMT